MRYVRAIPVIASLVLLAHPGLVAQEESQLVVTEGSRVRVTVWQSKNRLTATVQRIASDTLWVLGERASFETAFPFETIEKLETVGGSKRNIGKGALIGGGVGLVTGAGIVLLQSDCPEPGCNEPSSDPTGPIIASTAGLGALLGVLVGAMIKSDRWEEVDLPQPEPVVSLLPQRNHPLAIRIGIRLRI